MTTFEGGVLAKVAINCHVMERRKEKGERRKEKEEGRREKGEGKREKGNKDESLLQ